MTEEQKLAKLFESYLGHYILFNETNKSYDKISGGLLEISKEEHDNIQEADLILHEFYFINRKIIEIKSTFISVLEAKDKLINKLKTTSAQITNEIQEECFIDINRRLTNFIVSFKSLIYDLLISRKLPKIFGRNSNSLNKFIEKTKFWYDNNFSYKFLIRLRDFAVHYDFPIQIVEFKYSYNKKLIPPLILNIDIKFRKSTLAKNNEFYNKLKNELSLFNHEFPLEPLLNEISYIFDELLYVIIKCSDFRYSNAAKLILDKIKLIPDVGIVSYGQVILKNGIIGPKTNILNIKIMNNILALENQKALNDIGNS